jgi:YVTN family beta-propeller protein
VYDPDNPRFVQTRNAYVESFGARPVALVFARKVDDSLIALLTTLDTEISNRNASVEQKALTLKGALVLLCDDENAEMLLKNLSDKGGFRNIALAITGVDGPQAFRIAKEAAVTVLLYKNRVVKANYAFRTEQWNANAIDTIVSGLSALAGEPASLRLEKTIALKGAAGRLDHMAIDHEHGRLFIANLSNSTLDVVDLKAGKLIKQIPDQKKIQGVAYAPELDRIFVGSGESDACNVFDGKDYTLLKSIKLPDADNVRYHAATRLVYVAHAEDSLSVIDAKTLDVKATIKLPGSPEAFQLELKRPRLYLNAIPDRLVVVDTDKNAVLNSYPLKLAKRGFPMALDEANHRVFIGCRGKAAVLVMDSESGKPITSVAIPEDIDDLFYDAKRKRLYASCGEGFLAVLRQHCADEYELVEKIATAKLARTCLFDPSSGRLYLGLPRQPGQEGPQIRVYETLP